MMALLRFVDPHFHLWDVDDALAGHDGAILGGPAKLHPRYTHDMLAADFAGLAAITAAVHVEAIPRCGIGSCR